MASFLKRLQDTLSPPVTMPDPPPMTPPHPYYPLGANIAGYVANEWNTLELCSLFATGCAAIFAATYLVVKKLRPAASAADLATIMWFVLCG